MLEFRSGWWTTPIVVMIAGLINLPATNAILIATLIHELAHALAALTVGTRPRKLIIGYFPAIAIEDAHHWAKNAWIALAAPLANLLCCIWFGMHQMGMWSAGHLVVFTLAILPYPGSDSWVAVRQNKKVVKIPAASV